MRLHRNVVSFMSLVALLVVAIAGTAAAVGPPEMEIDLATGEVILEPHAADTTRVCRLLTK